MQKLYTLLITNVWQIETIGVWHIRRARGYLRLDTFAPEFSIEALFYHTQASSKGHLVFQSVGCHPHAYTFIYFHRDIASILIYTYNIGKYQYSWVLIYTLATANT